MDLRIETITAVTKRLPEVVPFLKGEAARVYCEYKAVERDADEPAREQKTRSERKIKTIIKRRLDRQLNGVVAGLNANYKGIIATGIYIDDDPEEYNALVELVYNSILAGITQAELEIGFALGDGAVNQAALDYARKYTTAWLLTLDDVTQKALRDALALLPQGGGATIGDIIKLLEPTFGTDRAWRIAVTETTRIYAEANQIFANELARQYPDFNVIKRWYTNADDRVCPICAPLNGKEVRQDEEFDTGIPNPPAHVNCRCWTSATVKS